MPTERVEVGPTQEPETIAQLKAMSDDERLALIRRLEAEQALLPELVAPALD
jgi:hypothetical protein